MISLRIDETAVTALISVLHRVNSNHGRMDSGDVWFDKRQNILKRDKQHYVEPQTAYKLCRALKSLKAQRATLASLHKSLEMRITHLQTTCNDLTLQCGIRQVPDEILSHILELAHCGTGDYAPSVSLKLSQVSRWFRAVALNTPRLWSTLTNVRPLAETRLFLSRSRAFHLSIILCFSGKNSDLSHFLHLVIPHSHRWLYLLLSAGDASHTKILFDYNELYLPCLTTIIHQLRSPEIVHTSQLPYHSWHMPSLSCYEGLNMVQRPNVVGTALTHCRLGWNDWSYGGNIGITVQIPALLQNLKDLPVLQSLSLEFENTDFIPHDIPSTPTCFSTITSLSLFVGQGTSTDLLHRLFHAMSLPNLRTLSVALDNDLISDCWTEIMFGTGHDRRTFRSLEYFSFQTSDEIQGDEWLVETVLSHCPSLLHLSINAPRSLVFDDQSVHLHLGATARPWSQHLALRTLRLDHCDRVNDRRLEILADRLRLGPNWGQFQKLEVISCRRLTEHFLMGFEDVLEGKLHWII